MSFIRNLDDLNVASTELAHFIFIACLAAPSTAVGKSHPQTAAGRTVALKAARR